MLPVIDIRDVRLEVDGRCFLDGADLQVQPGETVVVAGLPDSGKSLLLRLVLGMPGMEAERFWWDGDVSVGGQSLTKIGGTDLQAIRRRIGSLLRQGGLIDNMDIRRNISLPLAYHYRDAAGGDWIDARCDRVLADMECSHLGITGMRPVELDLEERLYASLARALVCEPFLLLLDDPCMGLSPGPAARLRRFLFAYEPRFAERLPDAAAEPTAQPMARLLTCSDLGPYLGVGDRFLLLRDRRLHDLGTAEQVRRSQVPRVQALHQGADEAMASLGTTDMGGALDG